MSRTYSNIILIHSRPNNSHHLINITFYSNVRMSPPVELVKSGPAVMRVLHLYILEHYSHKS